MKKVNKVNKVNLRLLTFFSVFVNFFQCLLTFYTKENEVCSFFILKK